MKRVEETRAKTDRAREAKQADRAAALKELISAAHLKIDDCAVRGETSASLSVALTHVQDLRKALEVEGYKVVQENRPRSEEYKGLLTVSWADE